MQCVHRGMNDVGMNAGVDSSSGQLRASSQRPMFVSWNAPLSG